MRLGSTVEELGQRMSAAEFREWAAYADCGDPWFDLNAETKADLRTGVLGATMANLLGSGKRRWKPSEFVPEWSTGAAKPKQSTDAMKRAAMKFAAAFANRPS